MKEQQKFYQKQKKELLSFYSLNLNLANFHRSYDPRLEDVEKQIYSNRHQGEILCSFKYNKPISKFLSKMK